MLYAYKEIESIVFTNILITTLSGFILLFCITWKDYLTLSCIILAMQPYKMLVYRTTGRDDRAL